MATRSGQNSIAYWGRYVSAAELPNVAGATVQLNPGVLETGDTAFVIGGAPYVCTTATPGAAVWAVYPMNFANTATAGPAAAAGTAASALRSDATIPIAFGSDARGDLAVRGASNYQRLAIGASGRVLASDGTDPSWTDPSTLLAGPFTKVPNSFSGDFNVATQVTSPIVLVTTAGGVVNMTNPNSLTKDVLIRVVKTNTGANGIVAKCPTGWNVDGGTVSTDKTIVGSNFAAKAILWYHTDIANLTIYTHPITTNGAIWWFG